MFFDTERRKNEAVTSAVERTTGRVNFNRMHHASDQSLDQGQSRVQSLKIDEQGHQQKGGEIENKNKLGSSSCQQRLQ
ncbi:hypothetical protein PVAP13_2KG089316 [Panicum virgatum]|uniref:Uncharacterized protein n=1 Tax=Panicum virgatum TaxID=38727 RepID=A0A8T0VZ15_PANVG|nr:hypothetical protein PVAP13_2KG089316 [Panicum virgatum]